MFIRLIRPNRNYLGTCFTCKQNMQFSKQNMIISLIFGLLKVHSSKNKYFYKKKNIKYEISALELWKTVFFQKNLKSGPNPYESALPFFVKFWKRKKKQKKDNWVDQSQEPVIDPLLMLEGSWASSSGDMIWDGWVN